MTKLVTPKGRASYPRLMRPDTKFSDEGTYSCDVIMSAEDAKPFLQKARKVWRDWVGKANSLAEKPKLFEKVLDDEGEETGDVKIRCRVQNKLAKKGKNAGKVWDRKPAVYDAKRNPLGEDVVLGGGSLVRCCLETREFTKKDGTKAVSFTLISVQVIDLVESGYSGGASGDDFDEEDGYEGDGASGSDFDDEDGDQTEDADVGDDDDF